MVETPGGFNGVKQPMPKRIRNEIGNTYGFLEVFAWGHKTTKGQKWWCYCNNCGGFVEVIGSHLRNGNTKSCGCLQKKVTAERERVDISEQRFGRLTAKHPTGERSGGSIIWFCMCNCGNTATISIDSLRTGRTKSCGRLKKERLKSTTGEKHPNWKSELSDKQREGNKHRCNTPKHRQWSRAVRCRDKKCQACGSEENLEAHHIKNWADNPELEIDINNGTTLCWSCHNKKGTGFHSIYGCKNNTLEQLEEFIKMKREEINSG